MNAADIIDRLGGPAAIKRATGVPATTISNWRTRNSIPARYHKQLLDLSAGALTADEIVAAHATSEATEAA